MQGDLLLQEWQQAKSTCKKIIEICKSMHLGKGNVEGKVLAPGQRQTNKQFINVYDVVYRLCLTNDKEQNRVLMVYKDYKDLLKTALLEMAPLLNQEKDVYRLHMLHKIWETYCEMQKRLNNMFAYLNRPYHLKNDKIEDLNRTSTNIISGTLFNQLSVVQYETIYFQQIDRIRKTKDMTNSKMLANLVSIFYQIHSKMLKHISNKKARTLFTEFYSHYQQKARQFYLRRFKILKQISPSQYFPQVNELYQRESEIAQNCFVITADTLINKQFAEELIINYKQILLNSEYGLKYILRQGQTETLKLIVDLNLKLTKSLDGFKEQFEQFIFEEMKNFIDDNKIDLTLKRNVINYCSFMEKLIRKNQELLTILEAINNVGDFVPYYKNGIEHAFLKTKMAVQIEELLAIYSDLQLRKQMNQQQMERQVKNIITIFNCTHNKDLFMIKYSQRFAKRILVVNETALNNHQIFINNLKLNCGLKYTEMIETIITEYRISRDIEPQLNKLAEEQKLPISFTLKMFSQGAWPTQTILELPLELLPPQLQHAQACIDEYRNTNLNKKTLKISGLESKVRWIYYFDPQSKCKQQTCYFDTNTLQAILLFYLYKNRPNKIPLHFFSELLNKINVNLIKQNLNKMSDVAESVLIKEKIADEDLYQFNGLLKSAKKLLSYDQGNSQQEEKLFQTHDLSKDREIVLDANLSKIMKAKKILDFKSLVQEVIKMIKVFTPQIKDIKIAIERLITKEIIQRDEKDRQQLRYRD